LLVDSDPDGATLVLRWLHVPGVLVGAACALTAAVQYSGQKAASLPEAPWATALLLQAHLAPFSVVVLLVTAPPVPTAKVALNALLAGSLNLGALGLLLQALARGTLSACIPLLSLTPASMFALGPVLLGEAPKARVLVAASILIGGTLLMLDSGPAPGAGPKRPSQRLAQLTAVAAATLWGLSATLDKQGVLQTSPMLWIAYTNSVMVLGLTTLAVLSRRDRATLKSVAQHWRVVQTCEFGALALLFLCEFALQNLAVLDLPAAVVMCLKRTSIPWSILLGRLYFQDAPLSWCKTAGVVIMFIGMVCLAAVA